LVYGMAELPITCSKEWFSSTNTNTCATTGIFPVAGGTLRPPHDVPSKDAVKTDRPRMTS
jgi:hypothetical protein